MPRWIQFTLASLGAIFAIAIAINTFQSTTESGDETQEAVDEINQHLEKLEEIRGE